MSEATPRPWIENAPGDIWHSVGPGGHIGTFTNPEDGQLAVRAVNSFDELVAACYAAEQALLHGNGGRQADAAFRCRAALQKARTP